MSLSLGSSSYSQPYAPPIVPDIYGCDLWYSTNPVGGNSTTPILNSDCQNAYGGLPEGTDLIEWAINGDPVHRINNHQLPFNSTFGTCTIKLYASGPAAKELDHILLSGNELRTMAGYLLQTCVEEAGAGGFITRSFQNADDVVTESDFSYLKKFPQNSTYFSLAIWDTQTQNTKWNPGNMEQAVSSVVVDALAQRKADTQVGTPAATRAMKNYLHYETINSLMQRAYYDTWWASVPPHPAAPQLQLPSSNNGSFPLTNQTLPPPIISNMTYVPLRLNASAGTPPCTPDTEHSDSTNSQCLDQLAHNEAAPSQPANISTSAAASPSSGLGTGAGILTPNYANSTQGGYNPAIAQS